MDNRESIRSLISDFSRDTLSAFLRVNCDQFRPVTQHYFHYIDAGKDLLSNPEKVGDIEFDETQRLIVIAVKLERELTDRTGKKQQYDFSRKISEGSNIKRLEDGKS